MPLELRRLLVMRYFTERGEPADKAMAIGLSGLAFARRLSRAGFRTVRMAEASVDG